MSSEAMHWTAATTIFMLFLHVGDETVVRAADTTSPNVIVIYADDLGYGDLGCYGSPTIRTPHLDRMASEGVRFTDFYSGAEVCTPSRAALLTGMYPWRTGMAGGRRVLFPNSKGGLPDEVWTLAEMFRSQGYQTSHIGKWHLGIHEGSRPQDQGFEDTFGLPYSNDMDGRQDLPKGASGSADPPKDGWNVVLQHNGTVIERPADQTTLTKRYTQHTIERIRHADGKPFFIYLAHSFPHVPLFASDEFRGKSRAGIYGDVVEELDASVGRILDELRARDLAKNTLVVFSSDNGPWLTMGNQGGNAGPLRDGKGSTWEGGMRVPGIIWMPGKIKPRVSMEMAAVIDLFPTCANLINAELPPDYKSDGVDLSAHLFEGQSIPERPFFFYRGTELFAVRLGQWKMHFKSQIGYGQPKPDVHASPLLFDLSRDVSEKRNVSAGNPDVVKQISDIVAEHKANLKLVPTLLN